MKKKKKKDRKEERKEGRKKGEGEEYICIVYGDLLTIEHIFIFYFFRLAFCDFNCN